MRLPLLVELAKIVHVAHQRAIDFLLRRLLAATPPQLGFRRVQKNRERFCRRQQANIFLLRERAAAEGDHSAARRSRFQQNLLQRSMLGAPESRLARVAKNLSDRLPLAPLNAIVEILELPAHRLGQGPADGAFAGAHESDQKHDHSRARVPSGRKRTRAKRPGLDRTRFAPIRFAFRFNYCFSDRFLRWILPLKERRTTVDDMATRPMVPAKARPLSTGNQLCSLGWSGISS